MPEYIRIRVIGYESSENDDNQHDMITITHAAEGGYQLEYVPWDIHYRPKTVMSDSGVFRWMRIFLRSLQVDDNPNKEIQIDWPLMPQQMIFIKKIDKAYNTILDMLEFHLDYWTQAPAPPAPSPSPFPSPECTIPVPADASPMSLDSTDEEAVSRIYNWNPTPSGRRHQFWDMRD